MIAAHPRRPVRFAAIFSALLAVLPGLAVARAQHTLVNRPAPQFARTDLQGARVDLAQDRGNVILLNFWATWCAPCRLEMPRFVQWQRQYGPRGLRIIGVSMDDSEAPVRPFVAKMRLDYPIVMGTAGLGNRYGGVDGVPVTFLIDRHGIVRARFDGGSDLSEIQAEMLKLLAAH